MLFLMLLRVIFQNRCVSRYRKLNGGRSLARARSRSKNSQITIDMHTLDSHDSEAFGMNLDETDVEQGSWKMNQQEFRNLVEI